MLRPFRVTSHGTYAEGLADGDVEDLENYEEYGLHPVHLGDLLGASNHYRVLHKLGQGGSGTIWLCRDVLVEKYVAVKVHTAGLPSTSLVDLRLDSLDKATPGVEFLATPTDHFNITGPNGTHQCIVLPFLGPPVSPLLWPDLDEPHRILRKLCYQATLALRSLHHHGICHGGIYSQFPIKFRDVKLTTARLLDFRPKNILTKLKNIDHLSEEELLSRIGNPRQCPVKMESGDSVPDTTPRYLVPAANLGRLVRDFMMEEIRVIDFGEAYSLSSPPSDLGIPISYLPPELLLRFEFATESEIDSESESEPEPNPVAASEAGSESEPLAVSNVTSEPEPETTSELETMSEAKEDESTLADLIGLACDIWALGCTLFEIRLQGQLVQMINDPDQALEALVGFFGKLPEPWWSEWKARGQYFTEDGERLKWEHFRLHQTISYTMQILENRKPVKEFTMPEGEQDDFEVFITWILRYKPEDRPGIDEVIHHPWFKWEESNAGEHEGRDTATTSKIT